MQKLNSIYKLILEDGEDWVTQDAGNTPPPPDRLFVDNSTISQDIRRKLYQDIPWRTTAPVEYGFQHGGKFWKMVNGKPWYVIIDPSTKDRWVYEYDPNTGSWRRISQHWGEWYGQQGTPQYGGTTRENSDGSRSFQTYPDIPPFIYINDKFYYFDTTTGHYEEIEGPVDEWFRLTFNGASVPNNIPHLNHNPLVHDKFGKRHPREWYDQHGLPYDFEDPNPEYVVTPDEPGLILQTFDAVGRGLELFGQYGGYGGRSNM